MSAPCTCADLRDAMRDAAEGREHQCTPRPQLEPEPLPPTDDGPRRPGFTALNDDAAIAASIHGRLG